MSNPPLNPPSLRYPFDLSGKLHPEAENAIRTVFNGLAVHEQAFNQVSADLSTLKTQVAAQNTATQTTIIEKIESDQFPGLGTVNDLSGLNFYTTQTEDNGALLEMNSTMAFSLSLNSTVTAPYFFFATNLGSSTATLTPTTGTINGLPNFALGPDETAIITFMGGNWVGSGISGGSVNSVGLVAPSWQTVTGSPVVGDGTLTITDNNQNANALFVGPATGSAAQPGFRAAVLPDYPFHDESLTDGNANFIFAATLTKGGDIVTVVGVPD